MTPHDAALRRARWPETDGEPVCPRCDCAEAYDIPTRRKFKCKACHHQFSVTSGTIFASRKLNDEKLLQPIKSLETWPITIESLGQLLGVQRKVAFVLRAKILEALQDCRDGVRSKSFASIVMGVQRRSHHAGYWQRSKKR